MAYAITLTAARSPATLARVPVHRLEVNATINLLKEHGLLPPDHDAPPSVNDLIAHVYDACARNGVRPSALRREVEALCREHLRPDGAPPLSL